MDFIVKDLMISVLPLRGVRIGDVASCGACTSDSIPPGPCGRTMGGWEDFIKQAINPPVALAALKQQLKETLAAVEAREKAIHESMRPTSAAEISVLQSHLAAALEELKAKGAALQSDPGDSPK
jgi:hypothetical protein